MVHIYGILDKRSNLYVYVGQSMNVDARWRSHKLGISSSIHSYIVSEGLDNFEVQILESTELRKQSPESHAKEDEWILKLKDEDHPIQNLTNSEIFKLRYRKNSGITSPESVRRQIASQLRNHNGKLACHTEESALKRKSTILTRYGANYDLRGEQGRRKCTTHVMKVDGVDGLIYGEGELLTALNNLGYVSMVKNVSKPDSVKIITKAHTRKLINSIRNNTNSGILLRRYPELKEMIHIVSEN